MNLQGKRAAIVTLGCKVNQYETDAMYGMLKEAGVTMNVNQDRCFTAQRRRI